MGKTAKPKADEVLGKQLKGAKRTQRREIKMALSAQLGGLHTTDAGSQLKSIWETNDLEEFLQSAEQNQKDFTAERGVRMVVQGVTHVYHDDKMKPLETEGDHLKWFELSKKLPIPQRPKWDHAMSKEHVEEREREAFLAWRRKLAKLEEKESVLMTPYERNLEVWRQLWRVVERSEVVCNILDARNPLAFRSKALEDMVSRSKKRLVLLLNKAELLTKRQRLAWGKYFKDQGITALFFSAAAAKATQDKEAGVDTSKGRVGSGFEHSPGGNENVMMEQAIIAEEKEMEEIDELDEALPEEPPVPAAPEAPKPKGKKSRRNQKKLKGAPQPASTKGPHPFAEKKPEPKKKERAPPPPETEQEKERTQRVDPVRKMGGLKAALAFHDQDPSRIYSPAQLIDFFLLHRKSDDLEGQPVMAGFVGYPNVGKSSTINVIWESKKVTVSSTPGKTKHFQTLILPDERRVMLCDCPGLVFPSFASTRDHMIVDGVLPISQVKDAIAPMLIVEKRVSKEIFEMLYTINLDWTEDKDESPSSAHLLCNQLARSRGYMTDHDKPNFSRAARHILQDYVTGKLVYVSPPPGIKVDDIEVTESEVSEVEEETIEEEELEEVEEFEEYEELEEDEEDEGVEAVNWDHVLPERAEKKHVETTEERFNKENVNVDAIYAKMLEPKTKKAHKAKHQLDAEVREVNEDGMYVVEVSDDDGIEEVHGPEIPVDSIPKKMTKRQQRMVAKNELRGRVGHHHKRNIAPVQQGNYEKTF